MEAVRPRGAGAGGAAGAVGAHHRCYIELLVPAGRPAGWSLTAPPAALALALVGNVSARTVAHAVALERNVDTLSVITLPLVATTG